MTDSTAPRILHTKEEAERTRVIGYNHIRLTPDDIRASQARRARRPSKWSRNLRYTLQGRMITSTRARFFFIWIICFAFSSFSLGLLWALGELIAGIAVASVFVALGCSLCGAAEFMIRCPRTVPSLLSDLGILKPIYDDDDENQDQEGYVYEERGGGHYFPDGDRDLVSEYDDYDEELLRSEMLEQASDAVMTKIADMNQQNSGHHQDLDLDSMSSPLADSSGDMADDDDDRNSPLECPTELLDKDIERGQNPPEKNPPCPLKSATSDGIYTEEEEEEEYQDKRD